MLGKSKTAVDMFTENVKKNDDEVNNDISPWKDSSEVYDVISPMEGLC